LVEAEVVRIFMQLVQEPVLLVVLVAEALTEVATQAVPQRLVKGMLVVLAQMAQVTM
jgi:hypothetical protein